MLITVDDLCLEYLPNFQIFDEAKVRYPGLEVLAFAISNFKNKESLKDDRFREWFRDHKWVTIGVHSYDHSFPPDGDREDEREWIEKAKNELREYLPDEYCYRSPGWQTTNKTVQILRDLGFTYIAYEGHINNIKTNKIVDNNLFNSHLGEPNTIRRVYEILQRQTAQG